MTMFMKLFCEHWPKARYNKTLKFIFSAPNPLSWSQDLEGVVSGQDTMQRLCFLWVNLKPNTKESEE